MRSGTVLLAAILTLPSCDKKEEPKSRAKDKPELVAESEPKPAPLPAPVPLPSPESVLPSAGPQQAVELGATPAPPLDGLGSASVVKTCHLDRVNNSEADLPSIAKSSTARLAGWAADMVGPSVPGTVMVIFEGPSVTYAVRATRGTKRPDVATQFNNPIFTDAGFDAAVSFANVAPGSYRIKLFQVLSQGGATLCDSGRVITLV
jgi:hypothetical protein